MAKKLGRPPNPKYEIIKKEYMSDPHASIRALAEKYGCTLESLKSYAKRNAWTREKKMIAKLVPAELIASDSVSVEASKEVDRRVRLAQDNFRLMNNIIGKLLSRIDADISSKENLEMNEQMGYAQILNTLKGAMLADSTFNLSDTQAELLRRQLNGEPTNKQAVVILPEVKTNGGN